MYLTQHPVALTKLQDASQLINELRGYKQHRSLHACINLELAHGLNADQGVQTGYHKGKAQDFQKLYTLLRPVGRAPKMFRDREGGMGGQSVLPRHHQHPDIFPPYRLKVEPQAHS